MAWDRNKRRINLVESPENRGGWPRVRHDKKALVQDGTHSQTRAVPAYVLGWLHCPARISLSISAAIRAPALTRLRIGSDGFHHFGSHGQSG